TNPTRNGEAYTDPLFSLGEVTSSGDLPLLDQTNPSSDDSLYQVSVEGGLTAGFYQATLVLHYTNAAGKAKTAQATLTFDVEKVPWEVGELAHTVSVNQDEVTIEVTGGVPAGAAVEYSRDQAQWHDPVAESSQDAWVSDLDFGTEYQFWARIKGDANHDTSAPVLLEAKVYTDYQTPVWDEVLRVNYANEQLEFLPGQVPAEFAVEAAGQAIGANGSLTALADGGGGPINLWRPGTNDFRVGPRSSGVVSRSVAGRRVAPTRKTQANPTGLITTVPAESMTKPTGKIVNPEDNPIEYRTAGSQGVWTLAQTGTASFVAFGTYEVRYPATESEFASAAVSGVFVNFVGNDFQITWTDATNGTGASGSQITGAMDATLGEAVQNGWTVVGSHQLAVAATTNTVAGAAFYRWNWTNTGADPAPTPGVTTEPAHTYVWTVTAAGAIGLEVEAFLPRTVEFDLGGASGDVPAISNTLADPDYDITLPPASAMNRPGYAFAGWNTLANGEGTSYASGAAYTMTAPEATLYAQWTSTSAKLLTLSGQTVRVTGGSGGQAEPFTAAITVPNYVTAVDATAAEVSAGAAAALFTDSDYAAAGDVDLTVPGTAYHAYVKVTAADGVTTTYWDVAVTRVNSGDKTLYSVGGQAFVAGTTDYTVPYGVAELVFGGNGNVLVAPGASATINGQARAALMVGPNPVTIVVTAEDGSAVTHDLTITRQASGPVRLVAVAGEEVVFDSPTEDGSGSTDVAPVEGSVTVDNAVAELTDASLATTDGVQAQAGLFEAGFATALADPVVLSPSVPVWIYIKVTPAEGTPAYYKVEVTRRPSADASLYVVAGVPVYT
ncbi:MAG: InlB B-repeat-containing protein, partial [Bifidobacteriaceae bacterium]|nr:InlB B-repeat-containing protein [Bifidobacteriaceae bacterium]